MEQGQVVDGPHLFTRSRRIIRADRVPVVRARPVELALDAGEEPGSRHSSDDGRKRYLRCRRSAVSAVAGESVASVSQHEDLASRVAREPQPACRVPREPDWPEALGGAAADIRVAQDIRHCLRAGLSLDRAAVGKRDAADSVSYRALPVPWMLALPQAHHSQLPWNVM